MARTARSLPWTLLVAGCWGTVLGGSCPAAAASRQVPGGPAPSQGESWSAIARLPDLWSGSWGTLQSSMDRAVQDCCMGRGEALRLTPRYQALRDAAVEHERLHPGGSNNNNAASCTPVGMPALLSHPMLFQYLFTPGKVTMLFLDGEVRTINTAAGAAHMPQDERQYPPSGDAIGHWDGATLVVDTVGISPRADLFVSNGIHTTKETHVQERMYLDPDGKLRIDTVVSEPSVFRQPYRYSRFYQRVPGGFDPGCSDDNRDNGAGSLDLTPPQ